MSAIKTVLDYWSSLRKGAPIPLKKDFNPLAVAKALPRVFLIERREGAYAIRLAGTGLFDMFGCELTNAHLGKMFSADSNELVEALERARNSYLPFEAVIKTIVWGKEVVGKVAFFPLGVNGEFVDADMFVGVLEVDHESYCYPNRVVDVFETYEITQMFLKREHANTNLPMGDVFVQSKAAQIAGRMMNYSGLRFV